MKTTFRTKLLGFGNNTGIEVPEANVQELGDSKRPPVNVDVNGFAYKSTVAVMGDKYMISLPKANREATGLKADDALTVTLELDEGVREVVLPADLKRVLDEHGLTADFDKLAYSKRKEFARQVADAKAEDTKQRRIEKIISSFTKQ